MEENLIEIAMKMILNAGDARNSIKEALDAVWMIIAHWQKKNLWKARGL